MRVRAFILLLSLSVYYLDVMAAVQVCKRLESNAGTCERNERSCSSEQEKSCPLEGSEDCPEICVTCPLFYNAVMAPGILIGVNPVLIGKQFPRFDVDFTNGFLATAWKPPRSFSHT